MADRDGGALDRRGQHPIFNLSLKWKSLQILNLANNNLEELPDNIHSFRELTELRLENNKLTDIIFYLSSI